MRRPTSVPPDLPGYTFVKLLGSGGFSDVFLYDQHLPKRRVAVKVLLTEELTAANRAAFVAEANLMAQLSAHPYIVSIFHADVASDDRPYFVMEYCSGPSLAERYKREPMAVADVLRTGVRVAGAVATAHAAGILHRDIKPANVLTNDYGWPALTDFGISSALDDELPVHTGTLDSLAGDTGTTGSASVGMSVPWSPPEMFEDDPNPDVRADVFSLAATLYTLLAGHTPFEIRGRSNGTLDLIGRIERGLVTPLEREDVPRSLAAVLAKGMASNREDRFATAVEFARAMQRVELELNYAPTTIDVPNLIVDDSVRDGAPDDDDATRARGVSTIEAQPEAPLVSPPPPTAVADATQVRGAQRVEAQPSAELSSETIVRKRMVAEPVVDVMPEDAPEPRPSKANRLVLWLAGTVAVMIAAGVAVSLLVTGLPGPAETEPTVPGGGGAAVVEQIPTPVLVSATSDGATVTFTVSNPDANDGDSMIWRRTDRGASEPPHQVTDGVFTADGATACVEVHIIRSGRESANPLETCYPA
ncbi:serine/threonine-protein kinase [Homoserinimonas sp. A447]